MCLVIVKEKVVVYAKYIAIMAGGSMGKDKQRELQEDQLGRYLKAALKQAGVTYEDLAVRLQEFGFRETKASIASKLGRGSFSASKAPLGVSLE